MTTQTMTTTITKTKTQTGLMPILFALLLGLGILSVTGMLQGNALHAAAHDVRHATGFPCH